MGTTCEDEKMFSLRFEGSPRPLSSLSPLLFISSGWGPSTCSFLPSEMIYNTRDFLQCSGLFVSFDILFFFYTELVIHALKILP